MLNDSIFTYSFPFFCRALSALEALLEFDLREAEEILEDESLRERCESMEELSYLLEYRLF